MKVTEQIDALRCMAVNPIAYLVVPRFVACVVMVPIPPLRSSVRPAATAWPATSAGLTHFTYVNSIELFT